MLKIRRIVLKAEDTYADFDKDSLYKLLYDGDLSTLDRAMNEKKSITFFSTDADGNANESIIVPREDIKRIYASEDAE